MAYWDIIFFTNEDQVVQLDAELYPDEDAVEAYMDEFFPTSEYQAEYNDWDQHHLGCDWDDWIVCYCYDLSTCQSDHE